MKSANDFCSWRRLTTSSLFSTFSGVTQSSVDKGGNEQGGQRRAEQSGETVLSHLRLRRLDEGELDVRLELLPDQRPVDQAFRAALSSLSSAWSIHQRVR
jgi:hypothetical protein